MKKAISKKNIKPATGSISRRNFIIRAFGAMLVSLLIIIIITEAFRLLGITLDGVKVLVQSLGSWGVVILIFLMALSVMSPLPDTPISVTAVLVYGPIWGGIIVFSGALIGAIADFLIIRKLGREWVAKNFPKEMDMINNYAKRFGFEAMVFFRIFPTVTFDIASYTAAVTKVKLRIFVLASIIGTLAPTLAYSFLGIGISAGTPQELILSIIYAISAVGIILFITKILFRGWDINKLEE